MTWDSLVVIKPLLAPPYPQTLNYFSCDIDLVESKGQERPISFIFHLEGIDELAKN